MSKKSIFFVVLAGILWGTSGIFVNAWQKYGLSAMQITSVRTIAAMPCMLIYALIADKKAFRLNIRDLPLYICGGITLYATAAFYYSSMQQTSISTAVILMYTAPVLVLAWSVAFFGEKINAKKAIAVVSIIVGCGLVSGIVGGLRFNLMGIICGLLSGLSYGIYNIVTKLQMRRRCNPITATLYGFFVAAIISVFCCDMAGIYGAAAKEPWAVVPLAVLHGVLTFVLPYFFYTLSLRELPAGVASSLAIIEPLSATLFGIVLFKEKLTVFSLIGIVMIIASVLVLSRNDG